MKITIFLIFLYFMPTLAFSATQEISIIPEIPQVSTDNKLYGSPNKKLSRNLIARVVDSKTHKGVAGIPVVFKDLVRPEQATPIEFPQTSYISDTQGFVQSPITIGSKPGDYVVSARIDLQALPANVHTEFISQKDMALFEISARNSLWPLILIMEIFAGLALFMYGISQLSTGMRNSAGGKLRHAMQLVTHNRFLAMTMGIFITVLFQSSCATTVMLVSFVQAGLLRAVQSLAIILGADIGTTMTVQLFAFKITDYALFAVAIGFFIFTFAKRATVRATGQAILGLGLLFFGMTLMQHSTTPLRSYEPFIYALTKLNSTLPAILVGAVFTALIRSSAAFIGIVIIFASQRLVNLETGIALCLGANLGTCVTAILASINASFEAKRVALAHMLFKVIGVMVLVMWIPTFAQSIVYLSGHDSTIERQIANAHSLFNIGIAFAFLPFLKQFNMLIEFFLPNKIQNITTSQPDLIFDRQLLLTPDLALSAAKNEIIKMGREAQLMVRESLKPVLNGEATIDKEALTQTERSLDSRYETIRGFLATLMERDLPEQQVSETLLSLRTLHDIEQIADIVEDRIIPRVEILHDKNIMLSDIGREELREYHIKILKQISRSLELFNNLDKNRAVRISERFERYCVMAYELKNTHFRRLQNHIPESEQTTNVHLNLISALLDISNLATNIARYMTEGDKYKSLSQSKAHHQVAPLNAEVAYSTQK